MATNRGTLKGNLNVNGTLTNSGLIELSHYKNDGKNDAYAKNFINEANGKLKIGLLTDGTIGNTKYSQLNTQSAVFNDGLTIDVNVLSASTNQPLLGNTQMRYAFSPRQQNALVGHKYVCYSNKNQQIRVVDGVTTAPDLAIGEDTIKSDFTRISTIRIVNYMIQRMRYALEPFIGAPNEFYNYNGMNTAIRAELDDAVERGVIQDATYTIRLGSSLDTAEVDLQILPQFELRVIDVTVALARPEGFINVNQ